MRSAAFGALGSELTCGGAAGGLQQDHQAVQVSEDNRQPKADVCTMCGDALAARVKDPARFPESRPPGRQS